MLAWVTVERDGWIPPTFWMQNQQGFSTAKRLEWQPRIMVNSIGSEIGPQLEILAPPHTSYLSSVTQFPNLKNGDNDSTSLTGLLNGIHKIM